MLESRPFGALALAYDQIMAEVDYEAWAEFVLAQAGGARPGRVLDLCCGTGNSSAPFLQRGCQVTGLDASAEMLRVAQSKWPRAEWVLASLPHFQLPDRYQLIVSFFDALNNLLDPAELLETFWRCRQLLLLGGTLACDFNTRLGVCELWEGGRIQGSLEAAGHRVSYDWLHHYDPAGGVGTVLASFQVDGQDYLEVHRERGYDPDELASLAAQAGFSQVDLRVFPDGTAPDLLSERVWLFAGG